MGKTYPTLKIDDEIKVKDIREAYTLQIMLRDDGFESIAYKDKLKVVGKVEGIDYDKAARNRFKKDC